MLENVVVVVVIEVVIEVIVVEIVIDIVVELVEFLIFLIVKKPIVIQFVVVLLHDPRLVEAATWGGQTGGIGSRLGSQSDKKLVIHHDCSNEAVIESKPSLPSRLNAPETWRYTKQTAACVNGYRTPHGAALNHTRRRAATAPPDPVRSPI